MKKTLVALAALASIGSAFADGMAAPTITPYARIDLGVGSTKTDNVADAGVTAVNGGYNTSTFGLKGESDIGGGSKVFGKVEAGFHPADTRGFAASSYGRTGIVGVSGGWGAVQLGMDWSPYDNAFNEAMDYNHFSAIGAAWNGGGVHGDNGNDAAISGAVAGHVQYTTPTVAGFNASLMYAPSKNTTTGNSTSYTSAGLNYNAGPLAITAAMEVVPTGNSFAGAAVGDGANTTAYVLTAAYNLGAATVFGAFESAKANGVLGATNGAATDTGSSLGVKVPMGDNTISAGYATETTSGDASSKRTAYSVQVLHALNKTASVYGGYVHSTDNTVGLTSGADVATNKWAAGLTFSF